MPDKPPVALVASETPPRARLTTYPDHLAQAFSKRTKHPLGDLFGLRNFGVNLTRIAPGGISSFRHAHTKQDEFIYILEGRPTLITDHGRTPLAPGMCAGFAAGTGDAHHLVNETQEDVLYLEMGDRTPGDAASYPDDDLSVKLVDGAWHFARKDGSPF
jgi:uncharacterized cupin superfamily protein